MRTFCGRRWVRAARVTIREPLRQTEECPQSFTRLGAGWEPSAITALNAPREIFAPTRWFCFWWLHPWAADRPIRGVTAETVALLPPRRAEQVLIAARAAGGALAARGPVGSPDPVGRPWAEPRGGTVRAARR